MGSPRGTLITIKQPDGSYKQKRVFMPKASTGALYGARRRHKKTKGSQSDGRNKNADTCQATTFDRFCAKRSRSYKHRDYGSWLMKTKKLNRG